MLYVFLFLNFTYLFSSGLAELKKNEFWAVAMELPFLRACVDRYVGDEIIQIRWTF